MIELLRELGDVKGQLGLTNGQLQTFIKQRRERDIRDAEREQRLRKDENRLHCYSGIAAAVGAMLGFGGAHTIAH
jgi:hypothetical protein